ncbi:MAG TPA: shikimate kinase [Acidobacteriaceae bacterium]|jgi:shikimate kinase
MSKPKDELAHLSGGADLDRRLPLSRLVLTGFMGAGKSAVGALLARSLGWDFLDLDSVLEASHGESIAETFRSRGESYFRRAERRALEQFHEKNRLVLALGGGTIEDAQVLSYILGWKETCLVFLDAPLSELMGRIRGGPHTRPLLAKPEELEARHQRRLPHYRAAHFTILTTGLSQIEVAARIIEIVSPAWEIGK